MEAARRHHEELNWKRGKLQGIAQTADTDRGNLLKFIGARAPAPAAGMEREIAKAKIVAIIMSFVRPVAKQRDPKPTIDEIEESLNRDDYRRFDIRNDGTVWENPKPVTVGEIADALLAAQARGELG